MIEYKPFNERTPDKQYRKLLKKIMKSGHRVSPIQGDDALRKCGVTLRFEMANGFPLITQRDLSGLFAGAMGELLAFINGVRTQKGLKEFGCNYWGRWLTKEKCAVFGLPKGDMGNGSYGVVWREFPTPDGPFDQISALIKQMEKMPFLRTHRLTNWAPQHVLMPEEGTRDTVVAPCHGDVYFLLDPKTKEMTVCHVQRSGDCPVGVQFNLEHYAGLGMMFAQILGYIFKELVFIIIDAHIYEMQFKHVETLLSRKPKRFPTVTLDPSITNLFDFRPEHFVLTDYDHADSFFKIPTPV